jgi:hypothetical protein
MVSHGGTGQPGKGADTLVSLPVPNAGSSPGTHGLVIGVSHYPFADGPDASDLGESFGIQNLTSAARSASEFAAWLVDEYRNPQRPLTSLRVLLSPIEGETIHPRIEALLPRDAPATRAAVEQDLGEFRQDCRSNPDNVAVVYIAGHGVQLNKRGAIVLLHDFGDPNHVNELTGAIDVRGCHDGMDEAGNAHQQVWFVDACRQLPTVARRFERLEGALILSERPGQVRSSPLFLASSTRESAFAVIGGTTLFSQALLWALRGAAALGPEGGVSDEWYVGLSRLNTLLDRRVKALAGAHGEDQNVDPTGRFTDAVIHRFAQPPPVEVFLTLKPLAAAAQGALLFNGDATQAHQWEVWPFQDRLHPGLYALKVTPQPPFRSPGSSLVNVTQPEFTQEVEVG